MTILRTKIVDVLELFENVIGIQIFRISRMNLRLGCPVQTYKSHTGNDNCTFCPDNSQTNSEASLRCHCADGLESDVVDGHLVRCLSKYWAC